MIANFIVVDLETSGMEPASSVIEIGTTILNFDIDTKVSTVGDTHTALFMPAAPLAAENIAIHHLTNEALFGFPVCDAAALKAGINSHGLAPAFLVAANCEFERKFITDEITGGSHWICTVKAAARMFPDAASHSNQATRYLLGLDLPEDRAMPPHRAGPDSFVTAHILAHILQSVSVKQLVQWTREPKHMPRCPIGKEWRGKPWPEVDRGFLDWVLRQADMDEDIKFAVRGEIDRRTGRSAA